MERESGETHMNKATIGTFLLAGAIALTPLAAQAATIGGKTPGSTGSRNIAWRFANQQNRIAAGLRTGRLSANEYARDEANLRAAEALRRSDGEVDASGKLSRSQRAAIERDLNHNSDRIYETKHNRVKGPGTTPSW